MQTAVLLFIVDIIIGCQIVSLLLFNSLNSMGRHLNFDSLLECTVCWSALQHFTSLSLIVYEALTQRRHFFLNERGIRIPCDSIATIIAHGSLQKRNSTVGLKLK